MLKFLKKQYTKRLIEALFSLLTTSYQLFAIKKMSNSTKLINIAFLTN